MDDGNDEGYTSNYEYPEWQNNFNISVKCNNSIKPTATNKKSYCISFIFITEVNLYFSGINFTLVAFI